VIAWTRVKGLSYSVQARTQATDGTLGSIHDFVTGELGGSPELDMDPSGHAAIAWIAYTENDLHSNHVMASVGP
jgi:hypothetical protein